ncbi:MAG TPA: TonB-dependent receptor, partial [Kofleriaceae bacterium]|nr:TonB-dependent receptor [Kofleriaceae bacterium]
LSGFYWDARDVIVQVADPRDMLLQFQNVGRYLSLGVEAELSYRNSAGWYGFGGICYARVGSGEDGGDVAYGDVPDAAPITANAGVSTPRLFDRVHVSTELTLLGARPTRPDLDGDPSPDSDAWLGWSLALYAPSIGGFDVTIGARNLIGKRDQLPAPGDYDRSMPTAVVIPRVPGEGREVFAKVGYAY